MLDPKDSFVLIGFWLYARDSKITTALTTLTTAHKFKVNINWHNWNFAEKIALICGAPLPPMDILSNTSWSKVTKSSQTLVQIYKDSSTCNIAIIDATEEFLSVYQRIALIHGRKPNLWTNTANQS